jgi:hypothetical protein
VEEASAKCVQERASILLTEIGEIMRASVAVLFLLALLFGRAEAQFRPAQPEKPPTFEGTFECAVVGRDPDEEGDDPFYKVLIFVEAHTSYSGAVSHLSGMTVTHVSASGRTVSRSDQYNVNASFLFEPTKSKLTWQGQFKDNQRMTMVGTFTFANRQWRYYEELTMRGEKKAELVTKAICHSAAAPRGEG